MYQSVINNKNPATHFIEVYKGLGDEKQTLCVPMEYLDTHLAKTQSCELKTIALFKIKEKS